MSSETRVTDAELNDLRVFVDDDTPVGRAIAELIALRASQPRVYGPNDIGHAPDEGGYLKRDFGVWRFIGDKKQALKYNTGTTDTYYGPIPAVPPVYPEKENT